MHEGVMQGPVSELVSWVWCAVARGYVHDEGLRCPGTSQGALSWREENTTVPVLLAEIKNDRQESAGPPACTVTKRIWGSAAWGQVCVHAGLVLGCSCWACVWRYGRLGPVNGGLILGHIWR